MNQFLGIGECMVELSPAGEGLWRQGFAGDVLNALWYARAALKTDDWQVMFHSAVGTDSISDDMIKFIESADISCSGMPRIADRHPGLYTISLDQGERSFSYWRDTSAAQLLLNDPQNLWDKIEQARVIYFSGITLAILPTADADLFLDRIRRHLRSDAILAFDPNIRTQLWKDEDRMREMISRAGSISTIVLPSFDDEHRVFGDDSPLSTVKRYLDLGASQVVVKNGMQPTIAADHDSCRKFPVRNAPNVVDTTAAGDSFAGTYLARLVATGSVELAVKSAQVCSAQVVGHKGALVPHHLLSGEAA